MARVMPADSRERGHARDGTAGRGAENYAGLSARSQTYGRHADGQAGIRSLVLNHSAMSRSITDAVYNRYAYDKEKRDALMAWEARLQQVIAASQIPVREAARA